MDDAVRVRTAAQNALEAIDPPRLKTVLFERLKTTSMAPGVLVWQSATLCEPARQPADLPQRAAGVQLIYEGLRLTRTLSHEPPWERDGAALEGDLDADLDILAADIFVSRGFYLLARTEAATAAVETVQTFGREQTQQLAEPNRAVSDESLEATIFSLAVRAGLTAVGTEPTEELLVAAMTAGRDYEDALPPAAAALSESLRRRLTESSTATPDEAVASSTGDS